MKETEKEKRCMQGDEKGKVMSKETPCRGRKNSRPKSNLEPIDRATRRLGRCAVRTFLGQDTPGSGHTLILPLPCLSTVLGHVLPLVVVPLPLGGGFK